MEVVVIQERDEVGRHHEILVSEGEVKVRSSGNSVSDFVLINVNCKDYLLSREFE